LPNETQADVSARFRGIAKREHVQSTPPPCTLTARPFPGRLIASPCRPAERSEASPGEAGPPQADALTRSQASICDRVRVARGRFHSPSRGVVRGGERSGGCRPWGVGVGVGPRYPLRNSPLKTCPGVGLVGPFMIVPPWSSATVPSLFSLFSFLFPHSSVWRIFTCSMRTLW
jgi:hypothetical protein